jgi:hypothetical protein
MEPNSDVSTELECADSISNSGGAHDDTMDPLDFLAPRETHRTKVTESPTCILEDFLQGYERDKVLEDVNPQALQMISDCQDVCFERFFDDEDTLVPCFTSDIQQYHNEVKLPSFDDLTPTQPVLHEESKEASHVVVSSSKLDLGTHKCACNKEEENHGKDDLKEETDSSSYLDSYNMSSYAALNVTRETVNHTSSYRFSSSNPVYIFNDEITNQDVYCGQHEKDSVHPGNVAYRSLVADSSPSYQSLTSKERRKKTKMRDFIIQQVAGRFVRLDDAGIGRFYVLTRTKVNVKVSQALRDKKETKRIKANAKTTELNFDT